MTLSKDLMGAIEWNNWNQRASETRLTANDDSGRSLILKQEHYGWGSWDLNHLWSVVHFSREPRPSASEPLLQVTESALQSFRETRDQSLQFVINVYRERRIHWPERFLKNLQKVAEEYEHQSTYILSRSRVVTWDLNDPFQSRDHSPERTIGAIRLIHEKNGSIPMEAFLGIRIRNPAATIKVEPGNFAIEPSAGEIANIELSMSIVSQIKRYEREFEKRPFFATYADPYSERLYSAMGLKYLTRDMLTIPESLHTDVTEDAKTGALRIKKDGVEWAPMYATSARMIEVLNTRMRGLAKHYHREAFLANFDQLMKKLTVPPEVDSFTGWTVTDTLMPTHGRASLLLDRHNDKQISVEFRLPNDDHRKTGREPIDLPLPVPEGFSQDTLLEHISYSRGHLVITPKEDPNSYSIEIWVDPEFRQPTRLHYKGTTDRGPFLTEVEF